MLLIISILIIGTLLGIAIGYAVTRGRNKKAPSALEEERQRQTERKEENKQKIVKLLEERKEIKNDDVEKLLGVSSVTAFRYLEELEKKGEIEQVGKTGRSVTYKKT